MRERERTEGEFSSRSTSRETDERGFRQNNTTTEAAAAAAVERGGKKEEEFIIDCARALCRTTTTSTFNTRAHGGPINITSNFHDVP